MNCFIVCNMYPPAKLNFVRAPGLRAEQLFYQAKLNFPKVKYLMLTSRKKLLNSRGEKYVFKGFYRNKDFIYIDDDLFEDFLQRIEPSVFVFSQLEMKSIILRAAKNNFIIYDILAPRHLELQCAEGFSKNSLDEAINLNKLFIEISDRVFVNGLKNLDFFKDQLSKHKNVLNNPFCPLVTEPAFDHSRNKILFFSGGQKWVDNSLFLQNIYECLKNMPEIEAIFVSDLKDHENPEAKFISKLVQLPNIIRYESLSYFAYKSLLSKVAGTLDWSSINIERKYSTSTRIIQSVGCGSAVFTLEDTGLDFFWNNFPGERSINPPSAEQIKSFICSAINHNYKNDLLDAYNWNLKVITNKKYFANICR